MAKKSDKQKVLSGLGWKFTERMSSQLVTFVLSVILARILLPEQYGLVAMINVFLAIANVFITVGFTSSLIQKKDADHLDFSTILWCSLTISCLLYVIMYFAAPYIEAFYSISGLASVTRVYSLVLIIGAFNAIQNAYVSRHMMFKKFFYSTFSGTLISGIIGIVCAYCGLGVWSIVAQSLSNQVLKLIIVRSLIDWRLKFEFSFDRAKQLMSYGSNILFSSLINSIFQELRQLLIGRYFSAADLAFYNRGRSLPHLVSTNIETSIESVLFPAMSNHSDQPSEIKRMMRRSIRTSSYIMYFFMTLLCLTSKPIILLLLTEKWADTIPFMQVICISSMIAIMSTANMQAIKASGRSDIVLKLEIIKKPVFLCILVAAVHHSVMAVALTMPLYALFAAIVNMYPNKKLLNYSIHEQIKDQMPATLLSLLMAICIIPISYLEINNEFIILLIQLFVGTVLYFGGSILFKVEQFYYIKSTIVNLLKKRRS